MESTQLAARTGASLDGPVHGEGGLDLRRVFNIIGKHKYFILAWLIIGVAVAVGIVVFMTPRYDAVVELNIHPRSSGALDLGAIPASTSDAGLGDWDEMVQTQALIVASDPLAWRVASQLRLDQNPTFMKPGILGLFATCRSEMTPPGMNIDSISTCQRYVILHRFSKALDVEVMPKTQALRVRFRSSDPKLAAAVVNSLTSAYVQANFQTRYDATMQSVGWLRNQLNGLKQDVENAGSQLEEYQKTTQIAGRDENDNPAMKQLTEMGTHVTDAEADRIQKDANYKLAMTGNPELIGNLVPGTLLPNLQTQEAQLESQLAQAMAEYGANYPKVIELQSQVDEVKGALATETHNLQTKFKMDYEAALNAETNLKQSMERLNRNAISKTGPFADYLLLKSEADAKRQVYDDVLQKLHEAELAAGVNATNVDVIAPAEVPAKPAIPDTPLFLLLGAAGGLIVAIVGTSVKENLDRSIRNIGEMREISGLPVLGMLPHLAPAELRLHDKVRGNKELPLEQELVQLAGSEFAEAVTALRTSLLLAGRENWPRTLMLTSPMACDGKSLVCMNLAASLASGGKRVLLVDADMRLAQLRARKGSQKPGLSECLAENAPWRELLQHIPTDCGTLFLLPAGEAPSNASEFLGSKKMDALMREWREEFDCVVFDTPPVASVTDAVVMSPKMDAVLLVARMEKTDRLSMEESCRRLDRAAHNIAGLVANDFNFARKYPRAA